MDMSFFADLKDAMAKWNAASSRKHTDMRRYDYR